MKPIRLACVVIMGATLVLAQSVSTPLARQVNGTISTQEQHELSVHSVSVAQETTVTRPTPLESEAQSTLFKHPRRMLTKPLAQTGPEKVIYAFQGSPDGDFPTGGVVFDSKGNLYGTTYAGGSESCSYGCGTVFELIPNGGGWTESILYSFQGGSDGASPSSGLVFDQNGNLYGTTSSGGSGCGTVFQLSPNGGGGWGEKVLYSFPASQDACNPQGVIFDQKGNLFGTATGGQTGCGWDDGFASCGSMFELSPGSNGTWIESFLYLFGPGAGPWLPSPGLIFDNAGNLYGTTGYGGIWNCIGGCGSVFEFSPNSNGTWTETTLYEFQGGNDASNPFASLTFDQNGNLYSATGGGGGQGCNSWPFVGCGTVVEIVPQGNEGWTETLLYSFPGGSTGANPQSNLIFDQDGNLYGTTLSGGKTCGGIGCGTVFELSPDGSGEWTEIVLYSFQGGSDPESPSSGVIFDQAGHLYGTASKGAGTGCGGSGCGAVFEVFPDESFAVFSPTSVGFGNQIVGFASSPQSVTLTNSGGLPLAITSIQITGTNSTDFGQTNNCPGSLTPQGSCNINVTFTPQAVGNRSAAVTVTDNAPGSLQTVPLSGTGITGVSLSPLAVSFPSQYVGTSGLPQNVTLSNTGTAVLTINNVTASPSDFAPLSACGNTVQPGAKCSIGVFFDPTTGGQRNGVVTITDSDGQQSVPLSGLGEDFSMAPSSSPSATVSPGQTANYTLSIAPAGGFEQMVTLSCTGAPAMSTCSVSPSSLKLSGSSAVPVTVSVATTGSTAGLMYPTGFAPTNIRVALCLAFFAFPGMVVLGGTVRKQRSRVLRGMLLLCVFCVTMAWTACGGGSGTGSGGGGTPTGSYALTVTGQFSSGSANLVHSTKLTLVVK